MQSMKQNIYIIFRKLTCCILIMLLAACGGRYASLGDTMSSCGFWNKSYAHFHECMDKKIPEPSKGEDDYYNKTSLEIRSEIDKQADEIDAGNIDDKKGFENFRDFVNQKVIEEQKAGQTAVAILAVAAVGVAAASCANSGCGSGFAGNNYYQTPLMCSQCTNCTVECNTGKACGNTCISASYECHVGRGTACNTYYRAYP